MIDDFSKKFSQHLYLIFLKISPVLDICAKLVHRFAVRVGVFLPGVVEDGLSLGPSGPIHSKAIVALSIVVSRLKDPFTLEAKSEGLPVVPII